MESVPTMTDRADISLTPASADDRALLARVYASTREEELSATSWSEAEKAAFCQSQFDAQDSHYKLHYTGAEYLLIHLRDQPVGRLYVVRWAREIRIMDIALLPAFRRQGIGSHLLGGLIAEAGAAGKLLSIHVERFNPALSLYQRLGFALAEDKGVYLLLQWQPPPLR